VTSIAGDQGSMWNDAMTAVLPLRIRAQKKTSDLDRLERLLLPSFVRFWRYPERLEFLIIVPPGDVNDVKARVARQSRFSIRVLSEDTVCPALSGKLGWHKQQIIKLAAARVVPTTWYLTLDADVMLHRAASPDDLIRDGKARFHPLEAARHWEWWMGSKSILHSPVQLHPDMVMMDVTPEILHRDTTLELLAEIGKRNQAARPEQFLFETQQVGWTEYSLYWLFVLERGLQDKLYRVAGPLYEGAWHPEHLASLARCPADAAGGEASGALFFILQSTLEIPVPEVDRLVNRISVGPDARVCSRTALSRLAKLLPMLWRRWR